MSRLVGEVTNIALNRGINIELYTADMGHETTSR